MQEYLNLVRDVIDNGTDVSDRTGVGTRSVFGRMLRFNLQDGFPATTAKYLAFKPVVAELLWFLEGSTDERRLAELTYGKHRSELREKKTIWTANADAQGVALGYTNAQDCKELGPVYGKQWVLWNNEVNQIEQIIEGIKANPDGRRHILSAWNASDISRMSLPPCHVMAQFRVVNGKLNCLMTQRSADIFLGVPFNIASYALLTHLMARECELDVGELILSLGDAHIYTNHFDAVNEMLSRELIYDLPKLKIADDFAFKSSQKYDLDSVSKITLENYKYGSSIKAPMAV